MGLAPQPEGITLRMIRDLMLNLGNLNDWTLKVSYLELYQEQPKDLLSNDGPDLWIREDKSGNIAVQGISQIECKKHEEITKLLELGSTRRVTGETNMNSCSSRSHAVFSILLEQKDRVSKLHFVDLAGSERQKRTKAMGKRFQESIKINTGLLALGNVINALSSRENCHVAYRDSKLTRVLQDSLGGNCKTVFIACVSGLEQDSMETLSTLQYANRAKNIKNQALVNIIEKNSLLQKVKTFLLEPCSSTLNCLIQDLELKQVDQNEVINVAKSRLIKANPKPCFVKIPKRMLQERNVY